MTGTLYGVSVGPGDPELLTLKAVRTICACDVIATPQTGGDKTLALDIAKGAVDLEGKTVVELPLPMTRDPRELEKSHEREAAIVATYLDDGHDVALLNLGDVSVYSTFSYLAEKLGARYEVVMVPGVTSFCATAAVLGMSLTDMNRPLHIIPASGMSLDDALDLEGSKVLMKSGAQLSDVIGTLVARGLADKTGLVQNCGLPTQNVVVDIEHDKIDKSYFTTIIVKE